ncbi:Cerato-platanin [Sanghuangporus baumii]|uniref:Cerato-platanin n=1 Tax=Sanghuangporus baumii TaxID=108892 RepID=A0A9Q5N415_SANBA|nr:Cerato-platanin [Sanghuangporus baumii]
MKLAAVFALPSALILSALAQQVTFDPVYDNANQSLTTVECSTGTNGLITRNFTTFDSLPTFPFIGGAQAVEGFNSAQCGSCWNITFNGTSIVVTAIDYAASGFNIALSAMNNLTNGQAEQVGVVQATATQLNASACGL